MDTAPEYEMEKPGPAVKKLRISQGMTYKALAEIAGVSEIMFRRFENGAHVLPEESMNTVCKAVGVLSVKELVEKAERTPDITNASVAGAIERMVKSKGMTYTELNEQAGLPERAIYHFMDNRKRDELTLERMFPVAKVLGTTSLAGLVEQAAQLPPPVDHERLRAAIEALQKDSGLKDKEMAENLDISSSTYRGLMNPHAKIPFSFAMQEKIPPAFGVKTVEEVIEKAEKLEAVPPREVFASALAAWQHKTGMQNLQLAAEIDVLRGDIVKMRAGDPKVAVHKLKKVPAVFGCESIEEMITKAQGFLQVPMNKRERTVAAGPNTLAEADPKDPSVSGGTWVDYISQPGFTQKREK